jgi:hypothetical protein
MGKQGGDTVVHRTERKPRLPPQLNQHGTSRNQGRAKKHEASNDHEHFRIPPVIAPRNNTVGRVDCRRARDMSIAALLGALQSSRGWLLFAWEQPGPRSTSSFGLAVVAEPSALFEEADPRLVLDAGWPKRRYATSVASAKPLGE